MPFAARVLVIDDEPFICDSLKEFLTDYNYEVESAESAEEALVLLAKTTFDIAIVDMRLPGMSGEALILKAKQIVPSLQYMIHTGSTGYRLTKELEQIGMHSENVYLKPVLDLTVFIKGIDRLMEAKDK